MNVPNELVYALAPPILASLVWTARQFVLNVNKAKPPKEGAFELTVKNVNDITHCIEAQFNSRYLKTVKALEEFDKLHQAILISAHDMRNLLAQPMVVLLEEKYPHLAKELTDKLERLQREKYGEFNNRRV